MLHTTHAHRVNGGYFINKIGWPDQAIHINPSTERDYHYRPRKFTCYRRTCRTQDISSKLRRQLRKCKYMTRTSHTYSESKTKFLIQPWKEVLILSIGVPLSIGSPPMYKLAMSIVLPSANGPNFISTGLLSSICMVMTLSDEKRKRTFQAQ